MRRREWFTDTNKFSLLVVHATLGAIRDVSARCACRYLM
jgi:hypothetical protein